MSTYSIDIEAYLDCFKVNFPFEIRDAFLRAFPGAQYSKSSHCWLVRADSKDRLDAFAAKYAEQCKALALDAAQADLNSLAISEEVLEELRSGIYRIKHQIEDQIKAKQRAGDLQAMISESKELLAGLKQQLETAAQQAADAQEAVEREKAEIDARLAKLINLPRLKGVVLATFAKYHGSKREMWQSAKDDFHEARDVLAAAGLKLAAIDYLCKANFNRSDRDGAKFMPRGAWYDLKPIGESGEE